MEFPQFVWSKHAGRTSWFPHESQVYIINADCTSFQNITFFEKRPDANQHDHLIFKQVFFLHLYPFMAVSMSILLKSC